MPFTKGQIHKDNIGNKYRQGKAPWNKGVPLSDEMKEKIRIKQKGRHNSPKTEFKKGCKHGPMSEETKKKISATLMGHPGANKGKKMPPMKEETKVKIREARAKQVFPEGTNLKRSQSNIANPNKKFKRTTIELKVEEELKRRGIPYVAQKPLCKIAIVDFFLPEQKIVIECDGCYYHNCPDHYPDNHKEKREKDAHKKTVLEANGFKVFRLWEHEIKISVEECINKVFN